MKHICCPPMPVMPSQRNVSHSCLVCGRSRWRPSSRHASEPRKGAASMSLYMLNTDMLKPLPVLNALTTTPYSPKPACTVKHAAATRANTALVIIVLCTQYLAQ